MKKLLALALALVFALSLALPFTAEARGGSVVAKVGESCAVTAALVRLVGVRRMRGQ